MQNNQNKEREEAVKQIREICKSIGCSGISKDTCHNNPHLCSIIRKILK